MKGKKDQSSIALTSFIFIKLTLATDLLENLAESIRDLFDSRIALSVTSFAEDLADTLVESILLTSSSGSRCGRLLLY
jgi:hypothetical protein